MEEQIKQRRMEYVDVTCFLSQYLSDLVDQHANLVESSTLNTEVHTSSQLAVGGTD